MPPARADGRLSLEEIRTDVRQTFTQWGFPDALQPDRDSGVVGPPPQWVPSAFTLWLGGLGIEHPLIAPGRPMENGTVERFHRTWDGLVFLPKPRESSPSGKRAPPRGSLGPRHSFLPEPKAVMVSLP